jgi:hypothetical protein
MLLRRSEDRRVKHGLDNDGTGRSLRFGITGDAQRVDDDAVTARPATGRNREEKT